MMLLCLEEHMWSARVKKYITTGFGFGFAPIMPGTFGTLWGIPLVLCLAALSQYLYVAALFLIMLAGIFLCTWYENFANTHDAKEVVIDEVVGYAFAMALLPVSWQMLLLAFVLFRFFDIVKPFPISWIDKKVKGGFGVMMDDVVAGVFSNIILHALWQKTNFLSWAI